MIYLMYLVAGFGIALFLGTVGYGFTIIGEDYYGDMELFMNLFSALTPSEKISVVFLSLRVALMSAVGMDVDSVLDECDLL